MVSKTMFSSVHGTIPGIALGVSRRRRRRKRRAIKEGKRDNL